MTSFAILGMRAGPMGGYSELIVVACLVNGVYSNILKKMFQKREPMSFCQKLGFGSRTQGLHPSGKARVLSRRQTCEYWISDIGIRP